MSRPALTQRLILTALKSRLRLDVPVVAWFVDSSQTVSVPGDLHHRSVRAAPGRRSFMLQLLRGVVPLELRHRSGAILVRVGRAVIGKERELRVAARED